jgi:hypothetical protein
MRHYFDIYIKVSASPAVPFDPTGTNELSFYDRLEYPEIKTQFSTDAIKSELGDGTELVDGEKVSIQTGTLRVSKSEYDKLRAAYHNKLCDFVLYDPQDDSLVVAAQSLRTVVKVIAETRQTIVIRIEASKEVSIDVETPVTPYQLIDIPVEESICTCLISGHVFDTDGVTPISDAVVQVVEHGEALYNLTGRTDVDGHYEILASAPALPATYRYDFTVIKFEKTFPDTYYTTVKHNGEYTKNFTALT